VGVCVRARASESRAMAKGGGGGGVSSERTIGNVAGRAPSPLAPHPRLYLFTARPGSLACPLPRPTASAHPTPPTNPSSLPQILFSSVHTNVESLVHTHESL
jgi:hypothetical protein